MCQDIIPQPLFTLYITRGFTLKECYCWESAMNNWDLLRFYWIQSQRAWTWPHFCIVLIECKYATRALCTSVVTMVHSWWLLRLVINISTFGIQWIDIVEWEDDSYSTYTVRGIEQRLKYHLPPCRSCFLTQHSTLPINLPKSALCRPFLIDSDLNAQDNINAMGLIKPAPVNH